MKSWGQRPLLGKHLYQISHRCAGWLSGERLALCTCSKALLPLWPLLHALGFMIIISLLSFFFLKLKCPGCCANIKPAPASKVFKRCCLDRIYGSVSGRALAPKSEFRSSYETLPRSEDRGVFLSLSLAKPTFPQTGRGKHNVHTLQTTTLSTRGRPIEAAGFTRVQWGGTAVPCEALPQIPKAQTAPSQPASPPGDPT